MKNLSLKTESRVLRALLWLVRPHLWHGVAIGLLLAYIPGVVLLLGMAFLPLVVAQFLLPKQNDQLVLAMLFFIIATLVHPCRLVWQKMQIGKTASLLRHSLCCFACFGSGLPWRGSSPSALP